MLRRSIAVGVTLLGIGWAHPLAVQGQGVSPIEGRDLSSASIRLSHVLELAQAHNPRLDAVRASALATASRVAEASTLPDPTLQLGIMNFGLPDFNADMPASMAPSLQIQQRIPFPGKLSRRGDIAEAASAMADAGSAEAEWRIREEAAGLFYDLYAIDRQTEVLRETLTLLQDFQTIARAMYSSGTGRQTDVLRADVEVARMDGEIREREAVRIALAARLNGVLNLPAETPVGSPLLGTLPGTIPEQDTLVAWAETTRPWLYAGRTGVEQANARVDLARRDIWPDLTVGFVYGQRDRGFGTEHMGSAMLGFTLPVHAGSRQLAAREEAEAFRRMANAELNRRSAEVDASIGELVAELERARSLIRLFRDEVLPEARINVESALSSYRVAAVDFTTLIDAQMTVNQYEGELFRLLADYGKAVSGLEAAVGRTLPESEAVVIEELDIRGR